MGNLTIVNEFFLTQISDVPSLQLPLFLFFLLFYLLAIIWNLLIIALIVTHSHLHVPLYFFLGNLAGMDLCCSLVTIPRMLFDLLTQRRKISVRDCLTQVFFLLFSISSETLLLSVMSYDRFTAICQPLHYTQLMNRKVCVQLMSISWFLGFLHSFVHTLYVSNLTFCGSDIIESFFCDLPQLFWISCSDTFINILLVFVLGGLLAAGSLTMTILSYVYIIKTVLQLQVKSKRSKVFSTCSSHLMVVLMFYCSGMLNYFGPSAGYHFSGSKVSPIFFTLIVPLLNPLIYSLRNQEVRAALHRAFRSLFSITMHPSSRRIP